MIKLTEEQVKQAFKNAKSDETKGILTSLFPDIAKELTKKKPTLDDYTSITSYEDACKALEIDPIPDKGVDMVDYKENFVCVIPNHIIALMKLETISRALWGRNWEPKPDAKGINTYYWPRFTLWTVEEIRDIIDSRKLAILSGRVDNLENIGFGRQYIDNCGSHVPIDWGFRLCQETEEKAEYLSGRNFVKLWAEYLQFNFTTGDFLITETPFGIKEE